MKNPLLVKILAACVAIGPVASARGQVVDVTASLDASTISAGGSTTLRVFAQVGPTQRPNADRIFSWYVDVLNTNGTVAAANYAAMLKSSSDNEPSTSSTGTQEGANRRSIYDTFLNLPAAGVSAPVLLMAIPVSGASAGQTRFRVQAGTGVDLSADFQVAPNGGGMALTGGVYTLAEALLTVTGGTVAPNIAVSLSVTNAGAGARGVTLSFPTTGGFNYTAQFRDQLIGGTDWQPLPGAPHNSGRAFELTSAGRRFYRVAITSAN